MNKKIEAVQMMRGIAALSVLFQHIGSINKGGFGVDLFFCISGFIMMFVTEKSCDGFIQKRLLRIAPLYYLLSIAAYLTAYIAPNLLRDASTDPLVLLRSFLFIGGNNLTVGVGWTLCYEMMFYGLFFIAFTINYRNRHLIATVLLSIIVFLGFVIDTDNLYFIFYTKPIILEFVLGMFAYKLLYSKQVQSISTNSAFTKYGLLLMAIGIYTLLCSFYIPAERFITWGIPTTLVFILTFIALRGSSIAKPLVVLGNISYSLYLVHTFVITNFSHLIIDVDAKQDLTTTTALGILLVVAATIGASYISWYIIENKLTNIISRHLPIHRHSSRN